MFPSWFGSIARSTACKRPTPLHEVETVLQILYERIFAPGAVPAESATPARMSATCVPWPPVQLAIAGTELGEQSIGFGSGWSDGSEMVVFVGAQCSPMKS